MPTGATNLGTQLGQLLFGRPDDGKAYLEGQSLGALSEDRMQSAAKSRAAAMIDQDRLAARQGITPAAMVDAGYADKQAPLLGNLLRSNDVVDLGKLGPLAAPTAGTALHDARAAVDGGDMALGNALLAIAGGKPIETTRLTDGQAFNPYGNSGQAVHLTDLGAATVGEKRASAADKMASVAERGAHAALYDTQREAGGFSPHEGGKDKFTAPSAPDAASYLANPQQAEAFTAWRHQHPEYPNGDEAWVAFRANRPIGAPTGQPGEGDGKVPVYDAPGAVDLTNLGAQMVAANPVAPAAPAVLAPSRAAPKVGTSEGGYIFKGGDPSKRENWVRATEAAQ